MSPHDAGTVEKMDASSTAPLDSSTPIITETVDAATMQPPPPDEVASPEPSGPALIERTSAGDYTCEVSRPVSELAIGADSRALLAPVSLGGVAHVFWAEKSSPQALQLDGPLKTAQLGMDGVLQPAQILFTPAADEYISPSAHAAQVGHDRITLWWDYDSINNPVQLPSPGGGPTAPPGEDPTSGLVQLDADDAVLTPSRPFDLGQFDFWANVVSTTSGYVAVWAELSGTTCNLELARLDETAKMVGTHVTLESMNVSAPPGGVPQCGVIAVAATPNGLALVYVRGEGDREVHAYRAFDADGKALATATRLAPADAYPMDASLIARGDDVLVAFGVAVGPSQDVGSLDATVRVARFGADGSLNGEVATLAPGRKGQFDRGVVWLDLGDALGVAWGREQKTDTSCMTACQYDGTAQYVVLDAAELTPRSAPIELAPDDAASIFGAGMLAPSGDDLLVVGARFTQQPWDDKQWSRLEALPGSATIHCDH
jgi:hypothetical protein